jgi:hypothetical protein
MPLRPGARAWAVWADVHQRAAARTAVVPGAARAAGDAAHRDLRAAGAGAQCRPAGGPAGRPGLDAGVRLGRRGRGVRRDRCAGRVAGQPAAADQLRSGAHARPAGRRPERRMAASRHSAGALVAFHDTVHRHGVRAHVGRSVPGRRRGAAAGDGERPAHGVRPGRDGGRPVDRRAGAAVSVPPITAGAGCGRGERVRLGAGHRVAGAGATAGAGAARAGAGFGRPRLDDRLRPGADVQSAEPAGHRDRHGERRRVRRVAGVDSAGGADPGRPHRRYGELPHQRLQAGHVGAVPGWGDRAGRHRADPRAARRRLLADEGIVVRPLREALVERTRGAR